MRTEGSGTASWQVRRQLDMGAPPCGPGSPQPGHHRGQQSAAALHPPWAPQPLRACDAGRAVGMGRLWLPGGPPGGAEAERGRCAGAARGRMAVQRALRHDCLRSAG